MRAHLSCAEGRHALGSCLCSYFVWCWTGIFHQTSTLGHQAHTLSRCITKGHACKGIHRRGEGTTSTWGSSERNKISKVKVGWASGGLGLQVLGLGCCVSASSVHGMRGQGSSNKFGGELRGSRNQFTSRRVMTPATQAAASSPREWPMTAEGTTPPACSAAAVPHSTANSAGWA